MVRAIKIFDYVPMKFKSLSWSWVVRSCCVIVTSFLTVIVICLSNYSPCLESVFTWHHCIRVMMTSSLDGGLVMGYVVFVFSAILIGTWLGIIWWRYIECCHLIYSLTFFCTMHQPWIKDFVCVSACLLVSFCLILCLQKK